MNISPTSLITTPICVRSEDKIIPLGTGFYYKYNWGNKDTIFLVTNYHVITGNRDIANKEIFPKFNKILIYYHLENKSPNYIIALEIPVFDQSGTKLFLFSHNQKHTDIALLPIPENLPTSSTINCYNGNIRSKKSKDIEICSPITVIGYPTMLSDDFNSLPIYSTGHIASEPSFNFKNESVFIVDTLLYQGNSGSPVFSINQQNCPDELLGIYSGRYRNPKSNFKYMKDKLCFGKVWKDKLIIEILNSYTREDFLAQYQKDLLPNLKWKITNGFTDFKDLWN